MVKLSAFVNYVTTKLLLILLPLTLIVAITSHFSTSSLTAQGMMRIAVLDFGANNVSRYAARAVSEILSTEIARKGDLMVIERTQMGAILQEKGFQMTGCTDSECAVQIGRVLSANKILIGTLSKPGVGYVYSVTARVVDIKTGHIEFAEYESFTREDDLESASRVLAVRLLNMITGREYSLPSRTYETGEVGNISAISVGYRKGQITGINVPVVRGEEITEEKIKNVQVNTYMVGLSYVLSDHFILKSNLKYYKISPSFRYDYYSQIGVWGTPNSLYYEYSCHVNELPEIKGLGMTLNIQYNYPMVGLIPFVSVGIGLARFELKDSAFREWISYTVRHYDGAGSQDAFVYENYKLSGSDYIAWTGEIALGFAFDISKYVSLVLSVGVEIPIAAKMFGDIEIKRLWRSTSGDLSQIPDEDETISDTLDPDDFKGNFPPIYFVQIAVSYGIY